MLHPTQKKENMASTNDQKPHAICIPYPAQGHINPMLKLAKLLHSQGFHITFVHTHYNYNRLVRSRGPAAVAGLPTFRFEAISDGMATTDADDVTQDISLLSYYTELRSLEAFKGLVNRLNDSSSVPRVSCIVSDASMFFTLDVAEELGVPEVLLWTASPCGTLAYAHFHKFVELGITPFKGKNLVTNNELNMDLDWLPACMNGIRLEDMPSFIWDNEFMFSYVQRVVQNSKRASAIVFNSFDALDHQVLEALAQHFHPLYTIGPLHLLHSFECSNDEDELRSLNPSLWKEDSTCLNWLDSHGRHSVVYVNFGSITVMTKEQLLEFAWGLANSHKPFLWIRRPDLVTEDSSVLPLEFLEETKERGLIANWCSQERVLAHPTVGGFLTHCGWNSTLECISKGVPMICWPFFAEQQTNCWFCCNKWGIGMEIDRNVKREEVERQVRELMDGEKGKVMKRKAMELKRLAHEEVSASNGSSYANLKSVVKVLLS